MAMTGAEKTNLSEMLTISAPNTDGYRDSGPLS
jgi:hypothetical protein